MRNYQFLIIFIILLNSRGNLYTQRDWSWAFGDSVLMQFNNGVLPIVNPVFRTRDCFENGSCIANENGDLLYFSNETAIYEANGNQIVNSSLNSSGTYTNGCIFLPIWGNNSLCIAIYLSSQCPNVSICPWLQLIKKSNLGDSSIVRRNLGEYSNTNPLCEKIAAVRDAQGTGWWVLFHGGHDNIFIKYKIEGTQVTGPFLQSIGSIHDGLGPFIPIYMIGEMTFSPLGDKLLVVTATGIIEVFDFDRCTGQISNTLGLGIYSTSYPGANCYGGCSFSADGSKIYVSENYSDTHDKLYQWDLSVANVPASKTMIFTYPDSAYVGQH